MNFPKQCICKTALTASSWSQQSKVANLRWIIPSGIKSLLCCAEHFLTADFTVMPEWSSIHTLQQFSVPGFSFILSVYAIRFLLKFFAYQRKNFRGWCFHSKLYITIDNLENAVYAFGRVWKLNFFHHTFVILEIPMQFSFSKERFPSYITWTHNEKLNFSVYHFSYCIYVKNAAFGFEQGVFYNYASSLLQKFYDVSQ